MNSHCKFALCFPWKALVMLSLCNSIIFSAAGQMDQTNPLASWFADKSLVWSGETNGFRVVIEVYQKSPNNDVYIWAVSSNQLEIAYVHPPSGKPPRMELRDTNGITVPPLKGKMDGNMPDKLRPADFPITPPATLYNYILFGRNAPALLSSFSLNDVYHVKQEEDYTLTVFPVIYKFEASYEYANRIDLPTITTKVHLKPPD